MKITRYQFGCGDVEFDSNRMTRISYDNGCFRVLHWNTEECDFRLDSVYCRTMTEARNAAGRMRKAIRLAQKALVAA